MKINMNLLKKKLPKNKSGNNFRKMILEISFEKSFDEYKFPLFA